MSSTDSSHEMEWKTIRVSGVAYYKLVELDGLLTVVMGSQPIPLSLVAEWAIYTYYDSLYRKLGKIATDPKKLEVARKQIGGDLKRLFEMWTKTKSE